MAPITRGNSLYTIVDGPSWTQAEANAVRIGGHLATVGSEEENSFILSSFSSQSSNENRGGYWIGFYSPKLDGNFVWSSGEKTTYTNWSAGQGLITDYASHIGNNRAVDGPYVHVIGSSARQVGFTGEKAGEWNDMPNNPGKEISWGGQYELKIGVAEIPFVQRGDSAYVIVEGPTWEEAEANAVKLGGHLVAINDASENSWLFQNFGIGKWIGLTDKDQEGTFKWSNGEPLTFTSWAPGEPTNRGNIQDYVWMQYAPGLWDDLQNDPGVNKGIAEIKLSSAPPAPTYSLSVTPSVLGEGETFSSTVATTNLAAGTKLYYALSGTGISAADFTDGALTGEGTVGRDGTFTFSKTLSKDLTTEGTETLNIRIYRDINQSIELAQIYNLPTISPNPSPPNSLTIYDTSTTPASTININGNNNGIANTGTFTNNGTINTGTQVTNITNTTNNTTNNITNTNVNKNYIYYNSNNTTNNTWNTLLIDNSVKVRDVITQWFPSSQPIPQSRQLTETKYLDVAASTWNDKVKLNSVAQAAATGSRLDAPQVDFSADAKQGSLLNGDDGNDELWGKAGWDVFDGGKGNDLIRAGNGRDILTGGLGADELHGDFGWNTYKSEKDGFSDLIAIKSDQFLTNWIYGKAGNNPDGEKADIIEGLDASDRIKIIGVDSKDISIRAGATAHGISGIGIYAGGALEALYTGGDLSVAQLRSMTSGDASAAAMANQLSSYGWAGV